MPEVLINPPASAFGSANAVLHAEAVRHYESRFAGPLSVKAVIRGRATWETREGRFDLMPGAVLLLHDDEEYSVTVDALQPVETFCLFFERGFVEDAARATATGSAALLDDDRTEDLSFCERLQFGGAVVEEIAEAHRSGELGASFYNVALALARTQRDLEGRIAKLPSLKASTRGELAWRLGIATSYLHANSARGVTIAEAARAACLSPFHFHRLFTQFHGITPHRYLSRLRLERARALLHASDGSVLDVALDCGFESLGSFAALYKRTFGVTPGAAKKQDRRNAEAAGGPTMTA